MNRREFIASVAALAVIGGFPKVENCTRILAFNGTDGLFYDYTMSYAIVRRDAGDDTTHIEGYGECCYRIESVQDVIRRETIKHGRIDEVVIEAPAWS